MQYFNTSNSEVAFIQDILRSTYIPTVRIFNSDVNIQPQAQTDTDLISQQNNYKFRSGETIIWNDWISVADQASETTGFVTKHNPIEKYRFGKRYLNITTNYISNKMYYDSDLHEQLGWYLRAYRDFYQIDLVPLYNCFSNRYITAFGLPVQPNVEGVDAALNPINVDTVPYDENYKIIAFPILFDTKYTIKFYDNIQDQVKCQPVYFTGDVPLGAVEGEVDSKTGKYKIPIHSLKYKNGVFEVTINSTDAKRFKMISSSTDPEAVTDPDALLKQRLLYLFVQFPASATKPIVVLEQAKFTQPLHNQLLSLPDNRQVAFTDTLLEYLTGNVITPVDPIHKNIHRIQAVVQSSHFYNKYKVGGPLAVGADIPNYKYTPGLFDEGLHRIIYKALFNYGTPVTDGDQVIYPAGEEPIPNFLGYVDKNVEPILLALWANIKKSEEKKKE